MLWDVVAKHESASFAGMRMKIKEHFEAFVLLSLLDDCLACGPNRRVVRLRRVEVHSIQVASHGV